ncbi:MAG: radical SAM protein [Candidatus Helarchaeota archaeon]
MKKESSIIKKIRNYPLKSEWINDIIQLSNEDLDDLLEITRDITDKKFGKVIKGYVPGKKFPAISITGAQCFLSCKHCNKHYLELMIHANTPEKLIETCKELDDNGAVGCLISGGFDENYALPFEKFLSALSYIKKNTNLILNVHTGLITNKLAEKLAKTGINVVSFDIVGDKDTIKQVYGIEKTPQDYLNSINALKNSNIKYIAPHICIGLNFGKIKGEIEALKLIKNINPYLIVLLALVPTKNTPMEKIMLDIDKVVKIIVIARLMFPTTPISLGCMRPGGSFRQRLDLLAFKAGITRIEIPSNFLTKYAKNKGYTVEMINSCCAIPSEFEKKLKVTET